MRTQLVAGNWKMHLTVAQAATLVQSLVSNVEAKTDVDVVVCPPYLALPKVREVTRNSAIKVGAQDAFWTDEGAFTGKVSPKMLADLCVDYCIVGHSETRGRFGATQLPAEALGYFAESDETVNLKVKALLYHAIMPILCVGETLAERESGKTEEVITTQLDGALDGIDPVELYTFVVAYEPVWAIGTGQTCPPEEAGRVCGLIRARLEDKAGPDAADAVRILYGGSVKPDNSYDLFQQPQVDGGLVGGASLQADGFARIVLSAKRG